MEKWLGILGLSGILELVDLSGLYMTCAEELLFSEEFFYIFLGWIIVYLFVTFVIFFPEVLHPRWVVYKAWVTRRLGPVFFILEGLRRGFFRSSSTVLPYLLSSTGIFTGYRLLKKATYRLVEVR